MLKNYIIAMMRNLLRHKGYTALNIFGLTIGFGAFAFIWLWVQDESSYDKFHKDHERIFIVMDNQTYSGKTYTFQAVPGLLSAALRDEIPEVEYATTVNWQNDYLVTRDTVKFLEKGIYVEPDFFHVFDFPILHSASDTPRIDISSIAVSRMVALKYFGETNVIGKSLKIGASDEYTISTVFEDVPATSSLQFNLLLPYQKHLESQDWVARWENNVVRCFVKLHNASQKEAVNQKIKFLVRQKDKSNLAELWLQELTRLRLYSKYENGFEAGGRIEYVNIFTLVAFSILLIASINFINLSTARSANRTKEVAMRKAVGANRSLLMSQFLMESVVMAIMAVLLVLPLIQLMLPLFNGFTDKQIINPFAHSNIFLTLLLVAFGTGILSGIYPAFLLSTVNPIKALKGQVLGISGKSNLRKSLVVIQLAISVTLIASSVVVFKQINYIKNKNLGLNKESILLFETPSSAFGKIDAYKNAISTSSKVLSSTVSSQNPLGIGGSSTVVEWTGKVGGEGLLIQNFHADADFAETFGIELIEGRMFKDVPADSLSIVINEEAVSRMNLTGPIVDQRIKFGNTFYTIVGVMRNFHSTSLHTGIEPVCIMPIPDWGYTYVKFSAQNIQDVIEHMKKVYADFESNQPFDYLFLADWYDKQYGSENITAGLALIFTILTVIISCLGLFGLASFTAEKRLKELGIRKALGATVSELVSMLCADYTRLAIFGILLGSPIAYYVSQNFLSGYAFHTELTWHPFILTAIIIFSITLIAISYQSIKATLVNPSTSLRNE